MDLSSVTRLLLNQFEDVSILLLDGAVWTMSVF